MKKYAVAPSMLPRHKAEPAAASLTSQGVAHAEQERFAEAEDCFREALRIRPDHAEAHFKLGNLMFSRGQASQAEAFYRRTLEFDPDHVKAMYNLGNLLKRQTRFEEAEQCYLRAIEIDPSYTNAYNNIGVLLNDQGRHADAEDSFRRCLALRPNDPVALNNLGIVLQRQDRVEEAEASFRLALEISPDYPESHNNLGIVLRGQGRLDEAEASYRHALEVRPEYAEAYSNLGNTLKALGRLADAEAALQRSLAISPSNADALINIGSVFQMQGRPIDAENVYREALALAPASPETHNNLGTALADQCRQSEAIGCFQSALELRPDYPEARSNLIFAMSYDSEMLPSLLSESRRYGEFATHKVAQAFSTWYCHKRPDRLRVGLVSGDLRSHPVGYFLQGLLTHIDTNRIDLIAYPTSTLQDELTNRIRPRLSSWRPIVGVSDQRAAGMIHADGVHVLLDLSGHTSHNRLPVFAWKPAPVQASWLGYCATTGVPAMDYYLADSWTLPIAEERNFTEQIWRLPHGYLCFAPPEDSVAISPPPALNNAGITFGSFNNLAKLNSKVIALWAAILNAVPKSKLFLKAGPRDDNLIRERIAQQFAAHQIGEERLILEGMVAERKEHFSSYGRVDIALDPFPYNGVTTTVEALWMGVPVLTCAGERFLSRQGVGLLTSVGLTDWISTDADDYVARAVARAADTEGLVSLRNSLRQRLLAAPLFNAAGFARGFEEALWSMWQRHEAQPAATA